MWFYYCLATHPKHNLAARGTAHMLCDALHHLSNLSIEVNEATLQPWDKLQHGVSIWNLCLAVKEKTAKKKNTYLGGGKKHVSTVNILKWKKKKYSSTHVTKIIKNVREAAMSIDQMSGSWPKQTQQSLVTEQIIVWKPRTNVTCWGMAAWHDNAFQSKLGLFSRLEKDASLFWSSLPYPPAVPQHGTSASGFQFICSAYTILCSQPTPAPGQHTWATLQNHFQGKDSGSIRVAFPTIIL